MAINKQILYIVYGKMKHVQLLKYKIVKWLLRL